MSGPRTIREKQLAPAQAAAAAEMWRRAGGHVVLIPLAFDLFHAAHARTLAAARALGTHLVVAIEEDPPAASPEPVLESTQRATLAAALRTVDAVVVHSSDRWEALVSALAPDVVAPAPSSDSALVARVRERHRTP